MLFGSECDLEESLSSSGQITLANDAGGDDSKANVMLDAVQVVPTADFHSVQYIVEIYPQLRIHSFSEKESLGKSDSLVALHWVSQAGIVWSRGAYSPSPRILKLLDVEDGSSRVVVVPIDVKRAGQDIGPVRGVGEAQRAANLCNLQWGSAGIIVVSGNRPTSNQVLHESSPVV